MGREQLDRMEEMEPVRQIRIIPGMTVRALVEEMGRAGAYNGGALFRAVRIWEEMLREQDTTRFFGLAGAMVPAGMGGIVADLIGRGYIDVLVTTGANCVHDIVEAIGGVHYHGTTHLPDAELRRREMNRIYDVFLPDEAFVRFEEFIREALETLPGSRVTIAGLLRHIGGELDRGFLATAARKGVPVYCPAFQDSMLGLHTHLFSQICPVLVDACGDMKELIERCGTAKKSGAILIGGGVPKNYILQSMLLSPKGLDYAIQLTGDRPDLGGLSGATLDEARSWGKLEGDAKAVTVYGDATITFPIMVAAVLERIAHA